MPPTVCAIVINYFGSEKTGRCLRSLVHEPLTTLLLVDNSAEETERAALDALLTDLQSDPPAFPIRPLYNGDNYGFGAAVNRAITADRADGSGHDYYLLINNDAEATPGLVARLVQEAIGNPTLALLSPGISWGDDDLTYYYYQPYLGHVSRNPFPGSFPYLSGCCLLVDARLAPQGALFDSQFFMYGEDILLAWTTIQKNRAITCVDDIIIRHEGSGSSKHGGLFYEYHVARGHVLLGSRLAASATDRTMMLAGRALYLGARALARTIRFRTVVPLQAYLLAWREHQVIPPPASPQGPPHPPNPSDFRV